MSDSWASGGAIRLAGAGFSKRPAPASVAFSRVFADRAPVRRFPTRVGRVRHRPKQSFCRGVFSNCQAPSKCFCTKQGRGCPGGVNRLVGPESAQCWRHHKGIDMFEVSIAAHSGAVSSRVAKGPPSLDCRRSGPLPSGRAGNA